MSVVSWLFIFADDDSVAGTTSAEAHLSDFGGSDNLLWW